MPPMGVNPGDFEVDELNTGRDGHVAPHHRLEPWGPISSLPLCNTLGVLNTKTGHVIICIAKHLVLLKNLICIH